MMTLVVRINDRPDCRLYDSWAVSLPPKVQLAGAMVSISSDEVEGNGVTRANHVVFVCSPHPFGDRRWDVVRR